MVRKQEGRLRCLETHTNPLTSYESFSVRLMMTDFALFTSLTLTFLLIIIRHLFSVCISFCLTVLSVFLSSLSFLMRFSWKREKREGSKVPYFSWQSSENNDVFQWTFASSLIVTQTGHDHDEGQTENDARDNFAWFCRLNEGFPSFVSCFTHFLSSVFCWLSTTFSLQRDSYLCYHYFLTITNTT